ncbi:MAG TPA: hypothetical protein DEH78_07160, partial [Solibacterales bacterium]|nr:hypothetical protein [Bryobacterales bacterium]
RVQFANVDRYRPSIDAVLADRSAHIRSSMGEQVELEAPIPVTVITRAARQMDLTFSEKGGKYRERTVLVPYSGAAYFELTHRGLDAVVKRKWEQILGSVQLGGFPPEVPATAPGFVRRSAGILSVDVPDELQPPKAYLFTAEQVRLSVSFRAIPGPPLPLPQIIMKETTPGDVISEAKEFSVETAAGGCGFYRYQLTREGPAEDAVLAAVRGRLTLRGGAGLVHLYGQCPAPQASLLERGFALLVNSFRLEAK